LQIQQKVKILNIHIKYKGYVENKNTRNVLKYCYYVGLHYPAITNTWATQLFIHHIILLFISYTYPIVLINC